MQLVVGWQLGRVLLDDQVVELGQVLVLVERLQSGKGYFLRCKLVYEATKCPNISLRVVGLILNHLGTHIAGLSHHCACFLECALQLSGRPERTNFEVALVVQVNVLDRKKAVDEMAAVDVFKSHEQLHEPGEQQFFGKHLFAATFLIEESGQVAFWVQAGLPSQNYSSVMRHYSSRKMS